MFYYNIRMKPNNGMRKSSRRGSDCAKSRFESVAAIIVIAAGLMMRGTRAASSADSGIVATVTVVAGSGAQIQSPDAAEWEPAKEEMELARGSLVKTDKSSRVEIQLRDNSILRIDSLTRMRIDELQANNIEAALDAGKLWCRIKKLEPGAAFSVKTPDVAAGVRGTTFWVEAEEGAEHEIGVEDGEVEAIARDRRIRLKNKMRIAAREGRLGEAREFDPEKRARWEKFTTDIVKSRFERMRDEAQKHRDDAEEALASGKRLTNDIIALGKDSREFNRDIEAALSKAKRIEKAAENIREEAAREGRGGDPKSKGKRLRVLKAQAQKALAEAESASEELGGAGKTAKEQFEKAADIVKNSDALSDRIENLRKRQEEMKKLSDMSRMRREFDPDWPAFKRIHDAAQDRFAEMRERTEKGGRLLSHMEDSTTKKTRKLQEIVSELREHIKENRSRIEEAIESLDTSKKQLKFALDRINAELGER